MFPEREFNWSTGQPLVVARSESRLRNRERVLDSFEVERTLFPRRANLGYRNYEPTDRLHRVHVDLYTFISNTKSGEEREKTLFYSPNVIASPRADLQARVA